MPSWHPEPADPARLTGDAYARGRQQAALGGADVAAVGAATVARVEAARAGGMLGADVVSFIDRQRDFAERHCSEALAEIGGIADGFGLPRDLLFTYLFLGIARDLRRSVAPAGDGCSAWAVGRSADGPLAAKNRDFHGTHLGVQRVFRHEDPSWRGGPVLCVGSLGAPGVYSSGVNAHGLALLDTQVGTDDHGIGWLRYFLMTGILAHCRSVSEAVDYIGDRVHAGGGSLVLADAAGSTAAVELGHAAIAVETGPRVVRTNHFTSPELAPRTLPEQGDAVSASSAARFAVLSGQVPTRNWTVESAARLMTSHDEAEPLRSLCQHGRDDAASTISTSVFACATRSLYFCEGNPCAGRWLRYRLDP